jgi:adenosylcobinamide kinase/adenosylcobinamide-phosphate guanylyltransferase
VLGGAASGKSAWAEALILSSGQTPVYLATSQCFDDEMRVKITIHQSRRDDRWHTIEAPLDLGPALTQCSPDQAVLLDCATMWLSNHMMTGSDLQKAQSDLLAVLRACPAPVVAVSNEVGQGIVPADSLSRAFREAQGRLNIALAAQSDLAVNVIAGLPMVLKGQLP